MRFEIEMPPPLSALYTNVPGKGRVKTTHYRKWIKRVSKELSGQAIVERSKGRRWPEPPYALDVWLYFNNQRRTDADNRMKAAQDAIARTFGFDDSEVADGCQHKRVLSYLDEEVCVIRVAHSLMIPGPLKEECKR